MMKTRIFLLTLALGFGLAVRAEAQVSGGHDTVVVQSGTLKLKALLWRPRGRGPFPAVLFNHGSGHTSGTSAGGPDRRHPELLGPVFARHGYVFLYLYRRGDGLSAGQGNASGDLMDRAFAAKGQEARNEIQLRLLQTDEMDDALAGLAFLRGLPEVDSSRVAVVGHSFGGSLTVFVAEHYSALRAIVTFGAAGYNWDRSPQLRARLTEAVGRISVPAFFIHAENDHSLGAGISLVAEMERLGKPHRIRIYPPVGRTVDEGHDFIHLRISTWEPDVFAFLDEHMRKAGGANEEYDLFFYSLKERLAIDDWTLTLGGLDEGFKEFFTRDDLQKLARFSGEIEPLVLASLREGSIKATLVAAYLRYRSALPILRKNLLKLREPYSWEGPDYRLEEDYISDDQYPYNSTYIEAIEAISGMPLRKVVHLTPGERLMLKKRAKRAKPNSADQKSHCAKWLLAKFPER